MLIRFIEFEEHDPYFNMAVDEAISLLVRKGKILPTFRLYGWNKVAVTIGEFQKKLKKLIKNSVSSIKYQS